MVVTAGAALGAGLTPAALAGQGLPGGAAADGSDPVYVPGEARAEALRDLAVLDACSGEGAGAGSGAGAPAQRLRTLYLLAVDDQGKLASAWEAHAAAVRSPWGRSAEGRAVTRGYEGALRALEGRHGFWPHRRIADLRRGLDLLEAQLAETPNEPEVRYLRLVSTAFLPGILGRGGTVEGDLEALARLLPEATERYPHRTWTAMADGVEALLADRHPRVAEASAAAFRSAREQADRAALPLVPGCRVG